ncbi:MAG: beta-ketoacyl-ACP synthase 3, partial [Syntrophomonadaceae bacterium]|nr:beta-ketoacyl-ACP synthase 3 [Syntrophomonadaceae bacterium]
RIAGTGWGLPAHVRTNADLSVRLGGIKERWVEQKSGIQQRRIAGPEVAASDLGCAAARDALARAGVLAEQVGLIVCATVSPDMMFPPTASLIQGRLGAVNAWAFDLEAASSGLLYGLAVADRFVACGDCDYALVVGTEIMSRFVDWDDRRTSILFGDGAGALLLAPSTDGSGFQRFVLGGDGTAAGILNLPAGGSRLPASRRTVDEGLHFVHMEGKPLYRAAVHHLQQVARELLQRTGFSVEDIGLFIPHQANLRILEDAFAGLGVDMERVVVTVDRLANVASANIAIAMHQAVLDGRLSPGMLVMLLAFGAGYNWGAALLRW